MKEKISFRIINKLLVIMMFILFGFLASCAEKEPKIDVIKDNEEVRLLDLKDEDFDVSKYELSDIPFVFVEKLGRLNNYKKQTIGQTTAKVLISYNQKIDNVFICNDNEKHLLTKSDSLLVKLYHEAYFDSSNVRYRESEKDDFLEYSLTEYERDYGYLPYGYNLEGFILYEESIISVRKIEGESLKYEITLDGEIGSLGVKTQMKKYGGFSDDPMFYTVVITLEIKEDFTPITITLHSEYRIQYPVLGKMNCTQDYVVTFTYDE